jgi:hypothetical protein
MKLYRVDSGRHGPHVKSNLGEVYAETPEQAIQKVFERRMKNLQESVGRWKAVEVQEWPT